MGEGDSLTEAYWESGEVAVYLGDCRDVMALLGSESVDCVVTDPPYGLDFMGKGWDHGVPGEKFWVEALRVAKPGAHLLAFGGTRTHHRLMVAIEDAGWEIRDTLMWLYGSGFPKSLDVSKAIDKRPGLEREVIDAASHKWEGWGTALKPAWEPIILARKPLAGTVAANVLGYGTGALNIDGCRIGYVDESDKRLETRGVHIAGAYKHSAGDAFKKQTNAVAPVNHAGRWPANILLSHEPGCVEAGTKRVRPSNGSGRTSENAGGFGTGLFGSGRPDARFEQASHVDEDGVEIVAAWECVRECPVRLLDEQCGVRKSSGVYVGDGSSHSEGTDVTAFEQATDQHRPNPMYSDIGGASRFFYTVKASKRERNEGMPPDTKNDHPTVKPVDLLSYLAKLICPPGGVVLDPFMGSGTTGVAAIAAGFRFVGIEQDEGYVKDIAVHRLAHAIAQPKQGDLFGGSV